MTPPPAPPGPAATFSVEERILLCCTRVELTDGDRQGLLALTAGPVDWEALLHEALRQAIVPLVYRHLQAHVADRVPAPILLELRASYLDAAVRSMALAAELQAIVRLLEQEGVDALPYKGPVLALQAYGDVALRTFSDLDIIVRPHDVARARALLERRGYAPLDPLTPSQEGAILKLDHNLPLLRAEGRIVAELHWRVAPASFTFTMPVADLFARSTRLALGDSTVRAMAVDDLMIVLPVHGSRHAWSAIEWIAGIAELMRRPQQIDWDEVMRKAEVHRVGRAVRLALALANRLLDAPIPGAVASWIERDRKIPPLLAWVAARLFEPSDAHSPAQQWALFKYEMAAKDRARDRLHDGVRRFTFPTGKDWEAASLPDWLFPLYFAMRPVRLLGRYLRRGSSRE